MFASLLLVLRGYVTLFYVFIQLLNQLSCRVALWARDRKVIVLAGTVWLTNLGGSIYGKCIVTLFELGVFIHIHRKATTRVSSPLLEAPIYDYYLVPSIPRVIHVGRFLKTIALSTARQTSGGAF